MDALRLISNFLQIATYILGPIALGLLLIYGMMRSSTRKPRDLQAEQDRAVRKQYAEDDQVRQRKEEKAARSDNPIDVAEKKTGTTG